jgi:hypothetical protein
MATIQLQALIVVDLVVINERGFDNILAHLLKIVVTQLTFYRVHSRRFSKCTLIAINGYRYKLSAFALFLKIIEGKLN